MLQRAARNAYSWWWASHIRTKQSKWLDDNLQDMEEKVEYMLKIVDDDGDSFRQRAEMYYKKRPELIGLVEESFRGYRALAERYDHLSKELQNANRTIASIYPERVQLHMDEEEPEDFPATDSSFPHEFRKPNNNIPDAPKLSIPKIPTATKNTGKGPSRLLSKKGLGKESNDKQAPVAEPSGLSKSEAVKEIDKLQKSILAFQTEKEFVKSSYENGVEKYWEIENQITEMQAKVGNLQDEFGVSSFIEDDEARTLMTTTALKSCQETLERLQQRQKQSAMAALYECQKVQEVRNKFKILKEEFQGNQTNQQSASDEQPPPPNLETMNLEKQIDTDIEGNVNVEELRAKIREELRVSSGDSLSMTEMAEKVDELVNKVIKMECEIASQNAYVKKLGTETEVLQEHLQDLQQEKESLIENSDIKNNKIRELEEELQSIQTLKKCVTDKSNNLQTHLTEASCNLDDLSEKLQNVKPDEEADKIFNDLTYERGTKSMEQFQEEKSAANEQFTSCSVEHVAKYENDEFSQSTKKVENFKAQIKAPDGSPKEKDNENVLSIPCGNSIVKTENINDQSSIDGVMVYSRHEEGNTTSLDQQKATDDLCAAGPSEAPTKSAEDEFKKDSGDLVAGLEVDEVAEAPQNIRTIPREVLSSSENSGESKPELPKHVDDDQIDFQFGVAATGPGMQPETPDDAVTPQLIKQQNDNGMSNQLESFNPFDTSTTSQLMKQDSIKGVAKRPESFNPFVDGYQENDAATTTIGSDSNATMKLHSVPSFLQGRVSEKDEATTTAMSKTTAPEAELRSGHAVDQGSIQENKRHDLFQKVYGDPYLEQAEFALEDDQPNWKELFLNGLDDREKILLKEYTSVLRSYKEVKMKLNDVEKKKRAGLFQHAIQVKLLRSSNAVKDAQIQSLHKKLSSEQKDKEQVPDSHQIQMEPFDDFNPRSPQPNQSELKDTPEKPILEAVDVKEEQSTPVQGGISYIEEAEGNITILNVEEPHTFSTTEEKIRMDIDELLEENIEFWLRFSTSFHQIEKFQNSIQDLQAELAKLREKKKEGSQGKDNLQLSEVRPIYRHLREILTELSLWLDHNSVLKDDLANRLSSLSSIQEEIARLSSIGTTEEEGELSSYQAAKFQGEIMNMKQENNKIANELEAGLARVKNLQVEIQVTLEGLDEELGISKNPSRKAKIPLRSFLFGVKLKKQRNSIFSCVTPSLQKQTSVIGT
ncbi:hypothetical protein Leryth_017579 [Lithospermum erythrorhizon]|nr:hypothetical protein Leryth_017579 [Lithospermum erythrorhizon]